MREIPVISSLFRKIEDILLKLEVAAMVAGNSILLAVCIIMVVCRYLLFVATPWADELARLVFLWIVFIGSGYVTSQWSHLDIQIVDKLVNDHAKNPEKILKILTYCCYIISLIVLVISTVYYWDYLLRLPRSITTGLKISSKWSTASAFIGLVLMDFHILCKFICPAADNEKGGEV